MAVLRHRLIWLLVAPLSAFLFVAAVTKAPGLIVFINAALFSASAGICCAYAYPTYLAFFGPRTYLDRADLLSIGIFFSWAAVFMTRGWSIAWRYLGKPDWLLESDILSFALATQLYAAGFHLAAPNVVRGEIPKPRWVRVGIFVAVVIFTALMIVRFVEPPRH